MGFGRVARSMVERRTGERMPIWYSLADCADRLASMSRKLCRPVSCANASTRYCSAQYSARTPRFPSYRATPRWKVFHGRKSMTCANRQTRFPGPPQHFNAFEIANMQINLNHRAINQIIERALDIIRECCSIRQHCAWQIAPRAEQLGLHGIWFRVLPLQLAPKLAIQVSLAAF